MTLPKDTDQIPERRSPGDMAKASGPPGLFANDRSTSRSGTADAGSTQSPASEWPADGGWVDRWLSSPRLASYLAAAGGDRLAALVLYEWNARVAAALLHDLCHLEIGLRNAYDSALCAAWKGSRHWIYTADTAMFVPLLRTRSGRRIDVNAKPRNAVTAAIRAAGGPSAKPGKIVAELGFGFWRYLSSASHEKTLWVPYLHRAFPSGTDRRDVDGRVGRMHVVRNRAAHHEPLFRLDLAVILADLRFLAHLMAPPLADYVTATSWVPALIAARPPGVGS
ncbi:hypothetical protein FDG2_2105 [Candidatus Protofrankia californiensis]|uniref:Abi-like protein n=1 Tax=Candidatus Protofrankia californiensis TaxID=1839754 RepID=A0A1C3NWX2_9ACTN|nr:hypothetical protein FDG2_2105 [Candidatus Protofrankia californiensis]